MNLFGLSVLKGNYDFLSVKGNSDDESRARYVGTELVERGVQ